MRSALYSSPSGVVWSAFGPTLWVFGPFPTVFALWFPLAIIWYTGYLEDGVIFDILDHYDMFLIFCVPHFSSLAWLEVCQEPPALEVILGGCWWFPTGYLEDRVILDVMECQNMWFLTCVPHFSSLAWLEVCQEPPSLKSILRVYWRLLTGVLEDGVITEVIYNLYRPNKSSWNFNEAQT